MKKYVLLITLLLPLHLSCVGQVFAVTDAQAQKKTLEDLLVNIIKQQQYQKTLEFTEQIVQHYTSIEALQQQVQADLRQVTTVRDLKWADLSKSLYLATELVQGVRQPGLEIDPVWTVYLIQHPLLQSNTDDIYQDLFMASSEDPLPADLSAYKEALHTSQTMIRSFHTLASQRKVYAAVAYQYLAQDLLEKAFELNQALQQKQRFSMTEAERLRLQKYCEDYFLQAQEMLATSDQLLLAVASTGPLGQASDEKRKYLERLTLAKTTVLDF